MKKRKHNPAKVMSHTQALALTKKVIAYGKKLLMHERSELRRRNPIEARNVQKFMDGIKRLDKLVIGSQAYVEALARAYGYLEAIKKAEGDRRGR